MKNSKITYLLVILMMAVSSVAFGQSTGWGIQGQLPGGTTYYINQNSHGCPHHHRSHCKRCHKQAKKHRKQAYKARKRAEKQRQKAIKRAQKQRELARKHAAKHHRHH